MYVKDTGSRFMLSQAKWMLYIYISHVSSLACSCLKHLIEEIDISEVPFRYYFTLNKQCRIPKLDLQQKHIKDVLQMESTIPNFMTGISMLFTDIFREALD